MDFASHQAILDSFEIRYARAHEYRGEPGTRAPVELDQFEGIYLPLTHAEWGALCQREGDYYVGGCCPAMSHVQDALEGIYRDDGYVKCEDLEEIMTAMVHHAPEEEEQDASIPFDTEEDLVSLAARAKEQWADLDPWQKVAFAWHVVKTHYTPKVPYAVHKDVPPLEEAFHVLSKCLTYFTLSGLFHVPTELSTPASDTQRRSTDTIMLSRILPALKMLNEHVMSLRLEPEEGFVIVDLSQGPEHVASNGYGYCFYKDVEEIKKLMASFKRNEEQHLEGLPERLTTTYRFGMRRARVSAEKGFEFLDDVTTPV